MNDLARQHAARGHAHDLASGRERGIGDYAHQPHRRASVHQGDPVDRQ
jgi:hypothetical protein